MKKSAFLTFVFSLIPGAGQMYYGYMKRGISIMGLFVLVIALTAMSLGLLGLALPIIWFFSFFDTHRIKNQVLYVANPPEDDFIFHLSGFTQGRFKEFFGKQNLLIGGICILFGAYLLYEVFVSPILYSITDSLPVVRHIISGLPTIVLAVIIILFGLYLLRGVRPQKEEFKEFTGNVEPSQPEQPEIIELPGKEEDYE